MHETNDAIWGSLLLAGGRRVVPDLRWAAQRLILEIDSTAWHADPLARADDRERQSFLEAHGETVLRVHWRDAVLRPRRFASDLERAGAPLREHPQGQQRNAGLS